MRLSAVVRYALLGATALCVVALERRRQARPYVEPRLRHQGRNIAVAAMAATTVRLIEAPVVVPLARIVARHRWGLTALLPVPPLVRSAAAILLLDYTLYLWHILTHRVPVLWRFHLAHHVDLDLDATTGLRFHAGELALSVPWRAAQIVAIGVTPGVLLTWQTLTLASVIFHHSNSRLPRDAERRLSWLLVTPGMHAVHHSVIDDQRDTNFSSGLAMWDRLHRTFRPAVDGAGVTIGVAGHTAPEDAALARVLRLPFAHRAPARAPAVPRA